MPQVVKKQYVSRSGEWVEVAGGGLDQATADSLYVSSAGDTMTGPLIVPEPTDVGHASTKAYVDTVVATQATLPFAHVTVGAMAFPNGATTVVTGGSLSPESSSLFTYDPVSGLLYVPGPGIYGFTARYRGAGGRPADTRFDMTLTNNGLNPTVSRGMGSQYSTLGGVGVLLPANAAAGWYISVYHAMGTSETSQNVNLMVVKLGNI